MKHQTVIRPASAIEAPVIKDIVRAAYARWIPVIGREPTPMTADYALALEKHRIDLLLTDDTILGLIEYRPERDHLWIENIAIRPEHQGHGLGPLLLSHAEQTARQEALPKLRLVTNAAFETNVRLYRRQGFEVERSEPFMGGIALYFRKLLT